jgi:hypothetical protein
VLIPQQQRDTATAALAGLDTFDVVAAIGALQLLPENANALFRLEAAAGVASTVAPVGAGAGIADEAAIAWVNRPAFGAVADPFNNVFTDEFLFHYGSFVVFPGLREEAFFVIRMLARAVLHARHDLPNEFFQPAQSLAAATLMLSDAVARKAGLHRGVDPAPQSNNYALGGTQALDDLKNAVSFTAADLARWLEPLPAESLAPLIQELPALFDAAVPPVAPLHRPLIRDGDRFVVAAPHFLLPALVHAILELGHEHDQLENIAGRFHDAVYGSVLQSALYLGWDEIDAELSPLAGLRAHESVFVFDGDKLAHVVVVCDDLATFDGDPFSSWDAQALAHLL